MINKKLWYIDGLKIAIETNSEDIWLLDCFKKHSEEIIYEACKWLITNDDKNKYYSLCLNGNEDYDISFIIQYRGDDILWFYVKNDYSDIKIVFKEALNKFYELVEVLQ
jgi:hypothetical protein